MANSITMHLKGAAAANELRMLRSGTKAILFLVEGSNDLGLLWAVFGLLKENVVVAYGKDNLDEAVKMLLAHNADGFIAIRDRDFDEHTPNNNLIVTHAYDLEMELLLAGALVGILEGYASQDKVRKSFATNANAALALVREAARIASLRHYCATNKIFAKFEDLKTSVVKNGDISVDIQKLLAAVIDKSDPVVKDQLAASAEAIAQHDANLAIQHPPEWLCVSHDLLWLLHVALRKAIGTLKADDCRPEAIRRCIHAVAQPSQLVGTTFYRNYCEAVGRLSDRYSYQGHVLDPPSATSA